MQYYDGRPLVNLDNFPTNRTKHVLQNCFAARLDTIFICKQNSDQPKVDGESPKYGLLRDSVRYDQLASLKNNTLKFAIFEDGLEETILTLGRTLLDHTTDRHIKSLIGKPYCPAEYKRYEVAKPERSWFDNERRAIVFVLLVGSSIIPVLLCCCICGCVNYVCSHWYPDEDELGRSEPQPNLASTDVLFRRSLGPNDDKCVVLIPNIYRTGKKMP
jgi:hypothetical protein